jgi:hypothetical protein
MLSLSPSPLFAGAKPFSTTSGRSFAAAAAPAATTPRRADTVVRGTKVELRHEAGVTVLDVPDGDYILATAIEAGLSVPHDCKCVAPGLCCLPSALSTSFFHHHPFILFTALSPSFQLLY